VTEMPGSDAFDPELESARIGRTPAGPSNAPVEADEADAADQAAVVPIDEDEYR
jgi:hypothetical protein